MTMSKPYVVGIDIGGTNTVFGIVDARGTIIASGSIKTQKYNQVEDYVTDLYTELSRLLEQENATDKIMGIGVGAPNGNYFNGTIEFAPNLPWKGVIPLAQMLTDRFGIPVSLTNDANAAAIGEMTYGAARGLKDFIMITLGTGVGSGIVVNGQLVYGHDGFAGELGHVIVRPNNGRLCGCGRTGCLILQLPVLHARQGNFLKFATTQAVCAKFLSKILLLKTYMMLPLPETSWLWKSSIIQAKY